VSRSNLLTIQAHSGLELAIGAALILLPFALGLSAAAVVLGFALGGLLAGLALAGGEPASRGGLPLLAHSAYDWALGTALLCAGIALGLADGPRPFILFLAAGLAELTLTLSTSYSERRA
jgi:hypothetical protein